MNIPLTPQLLGDLIEKGYTYMLSSSVNYAANIDAPVILKPVKKLPVLQNLPEGYETYYRITREPMQMVCSDATVMLDLTQGNDGLTDNDVYNDSYFRMSEEFFRQVLESLEDYAVFTTDTNGDVNSWNSGAENVLGYCEQEILGSAAHVFFTPEDIARRAAEKELITALTEGRAVDERFHVRKDGTRFWGTGLVFPLYDESGKHRGFTKIMRNLREEEASRENAPES